MFQIRKEQLDALKDSKSLDFVKLTTDFLIDHFEDASTVPKEELIKGVKDQVKKAQEYGLETERQIIIYVISAWALGEDFDLEFPAAKTVLESDETPDEKAAWLEEWTIELFDRLES